MAQLSDFLEKLLLDWSMTAGAATRPTAWFVALYTTATTDAGGGTEVTGGSYARTAVTFAAATSPGGTTENSGVVTFPTATASWGTVTHAAVMDASTAGNMLWHGALTESKVVGNGDTFSIAAGALDLALA